MKFVHGQIRSIFHFNDVFVFNFEKKLTFVVKRIFRAF
jgi:hypothetical protein